MFRGESPTVAGLRALGIFSELDLQLADLAVRSSGRESRPLALAVALTSLRTAQRHVCMDLCAPLEGLDIESWALGSLELPEQKAWLDELSGCAAVGASGAYAPFILDGGRFYLTRYHRYEQEVANGILALARNVRTLPDAQVLREALERLFPSAGFVEPDRQKLAAFAAVRGSLCVITGGPGTGKTTTVARILALLQETAGPRPLRICLAAPTGKAAARLSEAISKALSKLDTEDKVKATIPTEAATIHRLLGASRTEIDCRFNRENPLSLDVLVVDEASMVDLPLMAKLLRALPEGARLILLGDRDQLVSVEAGAVLGDICGQGDLAVFSQAFLSDLGKVFGDEQGLTEGPRATAGTLGDCIVELDRNYRFGKDSGIGALSRAIRAGDSEEACAILRSGALDLTWYETTEERKLKALVGDFVKEKFSALSSPKQEEALAALDSSRILSPVRRGPWGVEGLNALAENVLRESGNITGQAQSYHGRPIIICHNDHVLKIFNGDIGIFHHDGVASRHWVVFQSSNKYRKLSPARLPEYESVYSMTIHKSQGSEFINTLITLQFIDSASLSREMIYTAITRGKERSSIVCDQKIIINAIAKQTYRHSGLKNVLTTTD
jgi:exodeoxyribonuclease V alpha subunit